MTTVHAGLPPELRERRTLNLGCGRTRIPGALHVDITSRVDPDIVFDLDTRPWPLPDDQFDLVVASDVIEHLDDVLGSFEEIHRVCRPGARVKITVPHFSSANAFTDPTHRHYFGHDSLSYVTGEHRHAHYTEVRFRSVERQIVFAPTPTNKLVHRLARRFPSEYERRWAWMFPAWFLSFELEVLKPGRGA